MNGYKLEISLKRVQNFIFDVPRLKAMLGANALIGHTMRHELVRLMNERGTQLVWPMEAKLDTTGDPLSSSNQDDCDNPAALYDKGILARDGGHFIAVFDDLVKAEEFEQDAHTCLARHLPGVLYDTEITPFVAGAKQEGKKTRTPQELQLPHLPVLQICQETGRTPAAYDKKHRDEPLRYISAPVLQREEWGDRFYKGHTKDIIGLLRDKLYPDTIENWNEPADLEELTSGDYLALIHADGNRIGQRYKDFASQGRKDDPIALQARGETLFYSMRVAVRKSLVTALDRTFSGIGGSTPTPRPYEVLMLGGDDLLLACRAKDALTFAVNYSRALESQLLADGKPLHVAIGVAIAKPTYPLYRLQGLAESLASSAKCLYRAMDESRRESVIDWQVTTQSWFDDLEMVRQKSERIQYTVDGRSEMLLMSRRPYVVVGQSGLEALMEAALSLNGLDEKPARSALRALRSACGRGRLSGEMAFQNLPDNVRKTLGGNLWEQLPEPEATFVTRVLDIVGIYEISRLGRKKHG